MSKRKIKYRNHLLHYRRRMRFTQNYVAKVLKMNSGATLSKLENGISLPNLLTALKLAAMYRAPVEALFEDIFLALREQIREREGQLPLVRRTVAPLVSL